ncbi:hypothetical protein [Pelagicoccus albus]|uniref:Uncharacterized protein n=1 Tax=Pelagicoccus albus TaxID=415222 RepID=A0A7X1B8G2_9BACT|nr:hypothetical protein [Pelagicoccus albus]MBC2606328.1 hypothetical protein [Pelagicoccus albus]
MSKIEQFLLNPIPFPKNENGQLGFLCFLAIFPTLLVSAFIPELLIVCMVLLGLTFLLFAPYFLIILTTFFIPIIVAATTEGMEKWIDENLNYTVFTFLCILIGVGLMLWKVPKMKVAKSLSRTNEKKVQPVSPYNSSQSLRD